MHLGMQVKVIGEENLASKHQSVHMPWCEAILRYWNDNRLSTTNTTAFWWYCEN